MTSKTTFMRAGEVTTYLASMQVAYHTKSFFQNAVRYKFKDNVYYEREEVEKFANRNSPAALKKLVEIAAAKAAAKAAALEQQALDLETAIKTNKIMRTKSCTSSTMYLSLEGEVKPKPKPKPEPEKPGFITWLVFCLLLSLVIYGLRSIIYHS